LTAIPEAVRGETKINIMNKIILYVFTVCAPLCLILTGYFLGRYHIFDTLKEAVLTGVFSTLSIAFFYGRAIVRKDIQY
jgi:hypothetical protein